MHVHWRHVAISIAWSGISNSLQSSLENCVLITFIGSIRNPSWRTAGWVLRWLSLAKSSVAGAGCMGLCFVKSAGCTSRNTSPFLTHVATVVCYLYIVTLFRILVLRQQQVICKWWTDKGRERKRWWPNLRFFPGICLEGLRKLKKNLDGVAGLRAEIWTQNLPNTKQNLLAARLWCSLCVGSVRCSSYCISEYEFSLFFVSGLLWHKTGLLPSCVSTRKFILSLKLQKS
jgi:hypothetical protein